MKSLIIFCLLLALPAQAQTVKPLNATQITIYGAGTDGTNTSVISLPSNSAGGMLFKLPTTNGSNGQGLITNGSGTLSWGAVGTGTVSSGTQYQLGYYSANGTTIGGNSQILTNAANTLFDVQAGIAGTYTTGFNLQNTTAATSGATKQQSPSLVFEGHGWSTTATAADSILDWRITNVPTSAATATTSLLFDEGNTAGGFSNILSLSKAGALSLVTGGSYQINGTSVLNGTTLGSGITGSSLTGLGTITSGVWNGTVIDVAHGGTNIASGTANQFLAFTGTTTLASTALNINSTLTGNGIGSSLGINLATANTWTGTQTHGGMAFTAISMTALASNTNDWALTAGGTLYTISASTPVNVTGINQTQTAGVVVILVNTGSNAITLVNQSGSSTSTHRFLFGGGNNIILGTAGAITLIFDGSFWHDLSTN